MAGKVVNLRRARKRRARGAARAEADASAARHGLSRAEKTRAASEAELARRRLDGHRIETGGETGGGAPDDRD